MQRWIKNAANSRQGASRRRTYASSNPHATALTRCARRAPFSIPLRSNRHVQHRPIPAFASPPCRPRPCSSTSTARIDKTIDLIGPGGRARACSSIAFPETWVPGYPWWIWLDSPAWGMQFVQRYHDNSAGRRLARVRPHRARPRASTQHLGLARLQREGGGQPLHRAGADRRPGQHAADAPQAQAHPRRAHRVRRRRRLGPHRGRDGDRQHRLAVAAGSTCSRCSKYAMYAQNEQIHCGAWPSFSLYRGGAYALGAEVNNAASQVYAAEGQCFVVAPCATGLEGDARRCCAPIRASSRCCWPAAASRASTDPTARRSARTWPEDAGGAGGGRHRPRNDLAGQGGRRSGGPLFAARRHASCCSTGSGANRWCCRARPSPRRRSPSRCPRAGRSGCGRRPPAGRGWPEPPPTGSAMESAIAEHLE